MGSSWAFKITASLIKPTRESLLDYCSYVLIIIALISVARVIIGRDGLKQNCFDTNDSSLHQNKTAVEIVTQMAVSSQNKDKEAFHMTSGLQPHFVGNKQINSSATSKKNNSMLDVVPLPTTQTSVVCVKHFQAYFSYFVLVEAILLLLIGILWVKMPKVQSLINDFSKLCNDCQNTSWLSSAVDNFNLLAAPSNSNPLYSILKSDSVNMEVEILLATLFQTHTTYQNKSEARRLYERVQKFCQENDSSTVLWQSYIKKSVYQFILWMIFFGLNMALFVKMEFYIGCDPSAEFCDHDTFLRISWFMTQLIIIVYGIFNCITLKWINDKSTCSGSKSAMLSSVCGCFVYVNPLTKKDKIQGFICLPFGVGKEQRHVHNDVALLFHLVSSSNGKKLPYFTIFLFNQWEEQFKQAGESVQIPTIRNVQSVSVLQKTVSVKRATKDKEASAPLLKSNIDDTIV
uniref:Volume-regulated anion channel subunit LRRC8B n=1 Tax=Phallusia mammillata TaxID=59560 RepID=A0A6F9DJA7_9ASCI|nr:volume-regulated anion channel subunit LRRC8B [Phallusia mammillata]